MVPETRRTMLEKQPEKPKPLKPEGQGWAESLELPIATPVNEQHDLLEKALRNAGEGRSVVRKWPRLKAGIIDRTFARLDAWPARMKEITKPIKSRTWKRERRRSSWLGLVTWLHWRPMSFRLQIVFMQFLRVLKLLFILSFRIGWRLLLMYILYKVGVFLWHRFIAPPELGGGP